jgi:hypothetical protein
MMASEKVHQPFDRLMALSKAEGRRCTLSLGTVANWGVRLIPQDSSALHLKLLALPSDLWLFAGP